MYTSLASDNTRAGQCGVCVFSNLVSEISISNRCRHLFRLHVEGVNQPAMKFESNVGYSLFYCIAS